LIEANMRTLTSAFSLALIAALGGCYDPSLGAHPFLCGPASACPDGYSCDTSGVCVNGQAVATGGAALMIPHDAGPDDNAMRFGIQCNKDSAPDKDLEPNDTPAPAQQGKSRFGQTPLCHPGPSGCDMYGAYQAFAICTPGDVDYYLMQLKARDTVQFQIFFHVRVGDLDAAVTDINGKILTSSAGSGDNEIFSFQAPMDGKYFLVVQGYKNQTNTYDMTLTRM
jgi:hypothetical protein